MEPRGWYERGYLPHFDDGGTTQSVTFSLVDAIPAGALERLRAELQFLTTIDAERQRRLRLEAIFDRGHGQAWLRDPFLAEMVQNALLYFAGERYILHAWVIMPTHTHTIFTPLPGYHLDKILHSWKSFTSNKANAYLHRTGNFWLHESYDRYIRDNQHFANELVYIENNPVKAGLCERPEDWPWSSAYWRVMNEFGTEGSL